MNIRREPTYLSTDVWRVLKLMSQSESGPGKQVTVDEIADRIIGHVLAGCIPIITDRLAVQEEERKKTEKELIKTLQ